MSYFEFLLIFLGLPIAILAVLSWLDSRKGRNLPVGLRNIPAWMGVLVHIFLAVAYTTPWDNYLVATGVWTYDLDHVTGITLGWVPIEEYTFFVVQTILTSLWLLFWGRRLPAAPPQSPTSDIRIRIVSSLVLLLAWLASVILLASAWPPGTYLSLILVWAIPPILIQMLFGADLLWRNCRLVGLTLATATLYLSASDSLAINTGVWTIDPAQSMNIFLAGVLPVEEFVFFLVTNSLIVFGMALVLNPESRTRAIDLKQWLKEKLGPQANGPAVRSMQARGRRDPGPS